MNLHRTTRPALHALALSVALACLALGQAHAQAPEGKLKEVMISGSRSEQFSDDVPVTADILTATEMERAQVQDIRQAAEDLGNVSVRHAPSRFALTGPANNTGREGNAGFNIRGLNGNRVLMLEDGIRIPHSYVYGGNAFGRDYLSLDLVKRIEVVRGPVSALYGSEGMGGLVNFITYEPVDYLLTPSGEVRSLGGRVSASWSGDSHRLGLGATVAGRANEALDWMLAVNGLRGHGQETMGTNDAPNIDRTRPNPQLDLGTSVLGKLVLRPGGGQKHVLTAEHVGRHSDVNLLSSRARLPLSGTASQIASAVLDERAYASMGRDRLSWTGQAPLEWALADRLQAMVGFQRASSRQTGTSDLNTQPDRVREVTYDERTWQAGVQAERTWRLSQAWAHKLTYGLDYVHSEIKNLYTGVTPLAPEVFPLKRFPDTREAGSAVFAQSEWVSDAWSIVPGVRFDHFALDVMSQAGFYPPAKTPAKSLSGSAVSPKLGVLYRAAPQWTLYGNASEGFRAPNANQINGYYENSAEHVVIVPNPDLKPEKSQSIELGLRHRAERLQFDVAAFTGNYTNLIQDNVLLSGTGTAADPKLFQTQNTERARIYGFEFKGYVDLGVLGQGRLGLPFVYGQAKGVNKITGRPLNTIDPAHTLVGLVYRTAAWDVRVDVHHHAAKTKDEIDSATLVKAPNTQFVIPSATTLNLSGQWRIRPDLRLTASVINLTNQKYWRWADVQGLAASSTVTEAYTQPGRHLRVSLVSHF